MPSAQPPARRVYTGLRIIAVIKIAKGLLLAAIGSAALHLINRDLGDVVRAVSSHLRIDPENHAVQLLLEKVADVDPRAIRRLGVISFLFAADLFAEGIGLWFDQAWAKFLVILATGFFLPEEVYLCFTGFTWNRLVLLIINATVLVYVIHVVWTRRRQSAGRSETPAASSSSSLR